MKEFEKEPGCIDMCKKDEGAPDNRSEIRHIHASDWDYGHEFGGSVDFSRDYPAVGADGHDNGRGAVYIFNQDSGGSYNGSGTMTAYSWASKSLIFNASFNCPSHTRIENHVEDIRLSTLVDYAQAFGKPLHFGVT